MLVAETVRISAILIRCERVVAGGYTTLEDLVRVYGVLNLHERAISYVLQRGGSWQDVPKSQSQDFHCPQIPCRQLER